MYRIFEILFYLLHAYNNYWNKKYINDDKLIKRFFMKEIKRIKVNKNIFFSKLKLY